jgi:hypothetical protein
MVKIGFICEGNTEQILLQSDSFKQFLQSLHLESLPVIDAQGSGNLLPHNIVGYISRLEKEGAEKIIILTDLDEDICITQTKQRISARQKDIVIIAVKKIESWLLACSQAMSALLRIPGFAFQEPENEPNPFETINNLMIVHLGRGIGKGNGGKIKLITRLLNFGLDINQAAIHPNCPSASYFIRKLQEISKKP